MEYEDEQLDHDRRRTVGYVAGGICHELNNLLVPLQSHLAAVRAMQLGPSAASHLDALDEAVGLLRGLSDCVDVFAQDGANADLSNGRTDLVEWWRRLEPLLERAVPNDVQVVPNFDSDVPNVRLDANFVSQVILNLVMNSVRATESGGVITIGARSATEQGFVCLSVADDGCGMSADVRARSSIPFFTTSHRGLFKGLGLSLVQSTVRAAGGRLEIESTEGAGTKVSILLPVADEAKSARRLAHLETACIAAKDPRLASFIQSLLVAAGFTLLESSPENAREATLIVTDDLALARELSLSEEEAGVRVLALGTSTDGWEAVGVRVVDPREGLGAIRTALAQLGVRVRGSA